MKKEKNPSPELIRKSNLMKALMMIVFSLYCFAASAQSATSATAIVPGKASEGANSSLAEFVKNNPSDMQAKQAQRYAMILENPSAYPEFSKADLDRMQSEQNSLIYRINFIENKMKDGMSYDRAGALYQRELDAKAAMDKATVPNKSVTNSSTETAPALIKSSDQ